jgi:hypothetical protein
MRHAGLFSSLHPFLIEARISASAKCVQQHQKRKEDHQARQKMLQARPDAFGCGKAWPRCERSEIEYRIHENPWRTFPQARREYFAIAETADI